MDLKRMLAVAVGLYFLALGATMLWDPFSWYRTTPGVSGTGPFNGHFVVDIGLAFAASGALWLAAVFEPGQRAGLALGASLWPALHAGFHVADWGHHGLPTGAALWAEALGVVAMAALSLLLAILFFRERTKSDA